ncbi:MAG: stage V sporulation protein AB [Lachnospiraceae bacterium]|jgi:stage V sporulation protein AB
MGAQILMGMIGLFGGIIIASALGALLVGLGIIPRYAGITKTAEKISLYEDATVLGALFGNLVFLYHWEISVGWIGLAVIGFLFGVYLGSWIIALGEVVNLFAIMARRVGLTKGIGWVILSMAAGKMIGSWMLFFQL